MDKKLQNVLLFSDGAAKGNPGPGGYGCVLKFTDKNGTLHEKRISEGYKFTTNNRMELLGVIVGLEALTHPCNVKIVSDSKYVIDAFNKNWINGWIKNNWKNSSGPVKNKDLWTRLLKAKEPHNVTFEWVKGHNNHPENELCDKLAVESSNKDSDTQLVDIGYTTVL